MVIGIKNGDLPLTINYIGFLSWLNKAQHSSQIWLVYNKTVNPAPF